MAGPVLSLLLPTQEGRVPLVNAPQLGANSGFGPRSGKLLLVSVSCVGRCLHITAPLLGFGFTGGNAGQASNRVTLLAATQR